MALPELRHIVISPASARPAAEGSARSDVVRLICRAFLRLAGWKVCGDWPQLGKVVLVAAPHTSNWDGLFMLAAAGYYRVRLRWMGKASLTRGPFGWLIKALGCVPIDRSQSHDVVRVLSEALRESDRMVLAIPPEGTRSAVKTWKSGFYHIAVAAGVPILVSVLDYGSKRISLAAVVYPSGDYEADLPIVQAFYAKAMGKNRAQFLR